MNKIPAGPTIAFAYRFLFGQIGTVIAVAGGPAAAVAVADYANRSFAASQHAFEADAEPGGAVVLVAVAALATALIGVSASAVTITRLVLAQLGAAVPQPFVPSVIRMAAANLRFVLGVFVLAVLAGGITFLAYTLAGVPLETPAAIQVTPAAFLAGVVSWVILLYVLVSILRMGFLLPAVVTAEAKGGLKRSNDLCQGNVWRVLGIGAALVAPIILLSAGASFLVMRSALGTDFLSGPLTPDLMQRVQQAINEQLAAWELFNAVIFVLYSGLVYSGIAYAYREATERPASAYSL